MMSQKETKLLNLIRYHFQVSGEYPSYSLLARMMNYKSKNSVSVLIKQLVEKQVLEKIDKGNYKLTSNVNKEIQNETIDIPFLGEVSCGIPILAEENFVSYYSISKKLITADSKYFLLKAVGDSMNSSKKDESIEDGDVVLIKAQSQADDGDRVLALINNAATIKEYRKGKNYVALLPQSNNKSHKPIILESDFLIQGIVKKVFKQMLNLEI